MGDSFNIGTSLFSAVTVCLIAYTIYQQKEEFNRILNHSKDEEKINRTIKLIEEYTAISTRLFDLNEYSEIDEIYRDFMLFTNKVVTMEESGLETHIDFNLLKNFIIGNNIIDLCRELHDRIQERVENTGNESEDKEEQKHFTLVLGKLIKTFNKNFPENEENP